MAARSCDRIRSRRSSANWRTSRPTHGPTITTTPTIAAAAASGAFARRPDRRPDTRNNDTPDPISSTPATVRTGAPWPRARIEASRDPPTSARLHSTADPIAPRAIGQTTPSPNHRPASRRINRTPASIAANAIVGRSRARRGAGPGCAGTGSTETRIPTRYRTKPIPTASTTRSVELRLSRPRVVVRRSTVGCSHGGARPASERSPEPLRQNSGFIRGRSPMAPAARGRTMRSMDEPATTPTQVRRWSRRSTDRWFAGVASGVADGLDVEPWVVRLGFVVGTVIGGVGVLVYAFLWWLLPRRDLPDSAAQRMSTRFPGAPTWLGVGLLVVGVMLFAGQLGWWRPSLVFAFLLIGLGVLLFRGQTSEVMGPSP